MADQIAEPIQRHIEQSLPALPQLGNVACVSGMQYKIPLGATDFCLALRGLELSPGTYVRMTCAPFDERGRPLHESVLILGRRPGSQALFAMTHLPPSAATVRLTWRNAYHDTAIPYAAAEGIFLSARNQPQTSFPLGAVGLIAADASQVPDLLRDMVAHWPHYRRTAEQFSTAWRRDHDPQRIIEILAAKNPRQVCAA
jgi:hypothetical protein